MGYTTAFAQTDTLKAPQSQLDQEVNYSARDSMRFDIAKQRVYLYGNAHVSYGNTNLTAGYIEFSMTDNHVYAKGITDSTGKTTEKPHFTDGGEELTAAEVEYNFETKKGVIREVRSRQGEGYVHMEVSKKHVNDEIHLEHGKYTTCELDHPHYYFNLSKAIIIPDDKIVSGPVNLVVMDIPTPLALPFGFFPNQKRESKGILIPQYGESPVLGFFLLNGGYYMPLGKKGKADLQLLGDIYSRGSWGAKTILRYNTKYKHNGNLNLSFTDLKRSDPEFPDFSRNKEFFIRWQHNQDAKAHPYRRFSANVNAGTRNNFRNNFNTVSQDYLSNTFQSNISWTYSIPNKPINLSANLRHNQNSLTGLVNLTLPELAMNVNRFFPFQGIRKTGSATKKWYENIGMTYASNMRNDLTVQDTLLRSEYLPGVTSRMRNGMRHSGTISTSFKLFKQKFTLNPAASFTERWYLQSIQKEWDNITQQPRTDTLRGFKRAGDYSLSASLTTKIYGMYSFKGKRNAKLRHVITPSINLSYHPDFSTQQSGYFGPNGTLATYSPFDIGIYGKPPAGEAGLISLNLVNNIEMKFKSARDTVTGYKKLVLIENFTLTGSYNVFADSINYSNINLSGRTTLWRNLGLVYAGTIDPYRYVNGRKTGDLLWDNGSIGNFLGNNLAISWALRSKTKTASKGSLNSLNEEDRNEISRNQDAYIEFTIPWSLSINYNIRKDKLFSSLGTENRITQSLMLRGDLSLTQNWKIGFTSGYDFTNKGLTYTEVNIFRDLHCWEMRFNWIPFGIRKSYMIQINIKSSMLQDLRLMRRRSWFDAF
ncbi:MAG: putative LPS assembly protein LptD [Flavobacteriales bacterium]